MPSKRIAWPCWPATQVGFPKIVPLFPDAEESTRIVPLPSFIRQSPTGGDAAPAAPDSTMASSAPARARVGTTRRIRFIDMPYSLEVRGAGSGAGYRLSAGGAGAEAVTS